MSPMPLVVTQAAERGVWVRVCALEDLPRQGARVVPRDGLASIALFRTADDRVFALVDRCPHKGGPLSQGLVHGHRVACPLHNWSIDLATGEAAAPDVGCTTAFDVEIRAGDVYLFERDVCVPLHDVAPCERP